ncbi:hypothetical protein L0F63_004303, partial [Massospora cicadina]
GSGERCIIQFETEVDSHLHFREVIDSLKSVRCSWFTDEYVKANYSAVRAETRLPARFAVEFIATFFEHLPSSYI